MDRAFSPRLCAGMVPRASPQAGICRAVGPEPTPVRQPVPTARDGSNRARPWSLRSSTASSRRARDASLFVSLSASDNPEISATSHVRSVRKVSSAAASRVARISLRPHILIERLNRSTPASACRSRNPKEISQSARCARSDADSISLEQWELHLLRAHPARSAARRAGVASIVCHRRCRCPIKFAYGLTLMRPPVRATPTGHTHPPTTCSLRDRAP